MRLIAILPMITFVVALATVGVRLLLLARRTRELPEAAMGAAWSCWVWSVNRSQHWGASPET